MSSRLHRGGVISLAALGLAALVVPSVLPPDTRLVYNPSDSMPRGWYRVASPDVLRVGDVVLVDLPSDAAALAARRDYLPDGIPLLKRIGALPPQRVCVDKRVVRIDGVTVAGVQTADSRGWRLSAWSRCRRLREGELFLLSTTHPASFDSRYFGPVFVSAVIGVAHPLWTWVTP
jgi:conjugative transfer signal peptidase TraF